MPTRDATELDRLALVERLTAQDWIDEPFVGFGSAERVRRESPIWPGEGVPCTLVDRIETARRDIWQVELVVAGEGGAERRVPVGIVFDRTGEDARARIYYNKSIFGSDEPRRPVVAPEGEPLPALLEGYSRAIRAGDAAALSALVHPDAEIFGPPGRVSGAAFVEAVCGPQRVGTPGVPLQICSVTARGDTYAVEFISWRRPPHAGLGVYRFDDGLLVAARLYEGPVRR